jgi:hypothetical protein
MRYDGVRWRAMRQMFARRYTDASLVEIDRLVEAHERDWLRQNYPDFDSGPSPGGHRSRHDGRRATKAEIEARREDLLAIIAAGRPMTVRGEAAADAGKESVRPPTRS